jgi:hypothetical protein
MGGGIIIGRAKVLIPAANDRTLYPFLPANCKEKVDTITTKGAPACEESDVETLAAMILVATHC